MTKEQYFGLKNELKELASNIRIAKYGFRGAQKDLSIFQSKNGSINDYFDGRINSTKWESIRPEHEALSKKQCNLMGNFYKMKRDYRHKHIVYCFARGKTMNQIEPKVREKNEPSSAELKRLMKMYEVEEPVAVSA